MTEKMSTQGKVKVGKIKDAHGLKGELYFLSFSGEISWLESLPKVYLEKTNQDLKEYALEKVKPFKEGAILQFKDISDRTQAEALKGDMLYILEEELVSEPGEVIYLNEILYFQVKDQEGKILGEVKDFSSNGMQDILVIVHGDLQYEVPFVDQFVVEINYDEKFLIMDFPDGLMDINSEN